jgi:NAD(P)-dependent dehydrogenase (short-subunit alcohol dehydrogenase family)
LALRILLVGATGLIGSAVADTLSNRHQVIRVGRSGGEYQVDLIDRDSIRGLFREVGRVDAVVSTAGIARFKALPDLSDEDYQFSFRHKVMGQLNLVRDGLEYLAPGGSFTLTSGTLSTHPTPGTAAVAMSGAALEGWARAAALDLEGRARVNVVSPGWVAESMAAAGVEPANGIPVADLAQVYVALVDGAETGQVVVADRQSSHSR